MNVKSQYLSVIILLMIFGESACNKKTETKNQAEDNEIIVILAKLDSIGSEETFREAIPVAERYHKAYPKNIPLTLELAELYMLEYLVDEKQKGLIKAKEKFNYVLNLDSSFINSQSYFKKDQAFMKSFKAEWDNEIKRNNLDEIETLLIRGLITNFELPSK